MPDQSYPHVSLIYPQLFAKLSTIGEFDGIKKATARDQLLFLGILFTG